MTATLSEARPARAAPADPSTTAVWVAAMAVTTAAVWLGVEGWRALARSHDLGRSIASSQATMVGPVLVAVVLVLFVAERRWPAVARPAFARAHLVDAWYLVLFVLIGPLITLLDTGFAVTVDHHARFLVLGRLPVVPQVLVSALILVGIDAMNWVAHVANHRAAPLWRFHALHHSQEDMNVFTTFRTHPLSHASYLPALLPGLLLVASGTVPAAAVVVYGCLVTLPHANLRWTFGPAGRVLVSPAYHRLHHARGPVAGRETVNFGFVLVCWDRLAGCAASPTGHPPVATGLAGRPVPVEQDLPAVRAVVGQLLQPFTLRAAMDGPS